MVPPAGLWLQTITILNETIKLHIKHRIFLKEAGSGKLRIKCNSVNTRMTMCTEQIGWDISKQKCEEN